MMFTAGFVLIVFAFVIMLADENTYIVPDFMMELVPKLLLIGVLMMMASALIVVIPVIWRATI